MSDIKIKVKMVSLTTTGYLLQYYSKDKTMWLDCDRTMNPTLKKTKANKKYQEKTFTLDTFRIIKRTTTDQIIEGK